MAIPSDNKIKRAITKAFAPDSLTLVAYPSYKWVGFSKGDADAKIEFHDGWVNWTHIGSPGGLGWLADAHEFVRDELPALGVRYLEASGGEGPVCSEAQLKAHGPWRSASGRLRWDL